MSEGPAPPQLASVNRHEDASVNGLDTEYRCRISTRDSLFMKHLLAALVVTALCSVAYAQGTTPASPSTPQASSSTSAPAKSGTTKKAKKKKAKKPTSSTNASGATPTK
jgi:hypothetical protein